MSDGTKHVTKYTGTTFAFLTSQVPRFLPANFFSFEYLTDPGLLKFWQLSPSCRCNLIYFKKALRSQKPGFSLLLISRLKKNGATSDNLKHAHWV